MPCPCGLGVAWKRHRLLALSALTRPWTYAAARLRFGGLPQRPPAGKPWPTPFQAEWFPAERNAAAGAYVSGAVTATGRVRLGSGSDPLTKIEAPANIGRFVVRRSRTGFKGREVSMGFTNAISIYVRWPLPAA